MRKKVLGLGLFLLIVSVPVLVLMATEALVGWFAYNRYKVQVHNSCQVEFHGHTITLADTLSPQGFAEGDMVENVVSLHVDERDYSFDTEIVVRPFYSDMRRYASQLALVTLIDLKTGKDRATVVSRCLPDQRIQVYFIDPDGQVQQDLFSLGDRARPVYRTMLARFVQPAPVGFYSDVLQVQPSLYFPILYPFASAVAGAVMLVFLLVTGREAGKVNSFCGSAP